MIDPKAFYSSRIQEYSAQLKKLKQRSIIISAARLFCFLLAAVFIYLFIVEDRTVYLVAAILAAVTFIVFVRISVANTDEKNLVTQLLFLNSNEIAVLGLQDNAFDNGASATGLPMHATDLDIFGKDHYII